MQDANHMTSEQASQKEARERLLDAAEECFAENGFDGTSIRDLTAKANCNIAAVNYHFGGKEKLYLAMWRRRLAMLRQARIDGIQTVLSQTEPEPQLEDLIRAFANSFIQPLRCDGGWPLFRKLMLREMSNPHMSREMFIDEIVKPTMKVFLPALERFSPGLKPRQKLCVLFSIVGQLTHAIHIDEMLESSAAAELGWPSMTELVDHIVQFSAAAIRGLAGANSDE